MNSKLPMAFLVAMSVSIASHAARPVSGDPQAAGYLGVTSASFSGATEWGAMYAACQSDYGAGAKVCNTEQLLESPSIAGQTPGPVGAWIRPKVVAGGGDLAPVTDYSGRAFASGMTDCNDNPDILDARGLIVTANFAVAKALCTVARPAACCR